MKKLLALLLALLPWMALAQQKSQPIFVGFLPSATAASVSAITLNTSTPWVAYQWVPHTTKTLTEFSLYVATVTGTPAASDITATIYADNGGIPDSGGSAIETVAYSGSVTGSTWWRFTFNSSVTGGTAYWIVIKNINGTPGTHNITTRAGTQASPLFAHNSSVWQYARRSWNGSDWTTATATVGNLVGVRWKYSDSTFEGLPLESHAASGSGVSAYGSEEVGVTFTTPANAKYNLIGVAFVISKIGSGAGAISFKLYTGGSTTATATTSTIPANIPTTSPFWYEARFSAVQVLQPSTQYRVSIASSGGDTSNRWNSVDFTIENQADSLALKPYSSSRTVLSGGSWTNTTTSLIPFALVLDTSGEFKKAGSAPVVVQ